MKLTTSFGLRFTIRDVFELAEKSGVADQEFAVDLRDGIRGAVRMRDPIQSLELTVHLNVPFNLLAAFMDEKGIRIPE